MRPCFRPALINALVAALAASTWCAAASAADGDLDPGFSEDGFAFKRPGPHTVARAVTTQADGRILVGLRQWSGLCRLCVPDVTEYVARFNADGSVDRTFGESGLVRLRPTYKSLQDPHIDVAVQSDGRIVVSADATGDFFVTRLLSDGGRDLSFGGGDGIVAEIPTTARVTLQRLGLTADQRIVIALSTYSEADRPGVAVARLLGDGSPDASFSGDGFAAEATEAVLEDAAVDPSGAVLILARPVQGPGELALRYRPDGTVDPAYAEGGVRRVPIDDLPVDDLALDASGRVTFVGFQDARPLGSYVGRLNQDGALDSTFAADGLVRLDARRSILNRTPLAFQNLVVDSNGRTIVAAQDRGVIVGRLTETGAMDPSFSGDGWTENHVRGAFFPEGPVGEIATAGSEIFVAAAVGGRPPSEDQPAGGGALLDYLGADSRPGDSDADGMTGRADRCPLLFRKCPALAVRIGASYHRRSDEIRGWLHSGYDACSETTVSIYRRQPGRNPKVATTAARSYFAVEFHPQPRTRYYARVRPHQLGYGTCERARASVRQLGSV